MIESVKVIGMCWLTLFSTYASQAFCAQFGDQIIRPEPVVFGGERVIRERQLFNFIVAVHYRDPKSGPGGCTGILIDPLIVLTAAHCTGKDVKVIFCGPASGPCRQVEIRTVAARVIPEEFAAKALTKGVVNSSDIQLLKMVSNAPLWASPAILADFYDGTDASAFGIAGFGLDAPGRLPGEDAFDPNAEEIEGEQLNFATIHRVTSRHRGILEFDQTTGGGGCLGDSGAPVLRITDNNRQDVVGLFHQISSTVTCKSRGFAILLAPWLPWIAENMRRLLPQ